MKLHTPSGLWFPVSEQRPQKMYDGLMKYIRDSDFLLSLLQKKSRWRTCVQAGGHIGLWPIRLAPHFAKLYTFEPDPLVFAALQRNVAVAPNIIPVAAALGDQHSVGRLSYYSKRTAVASMAEVKNEGDLSCTVDVYCIDDLEENVAAIVLDVEGYEPWALRGAAQTIKRCRPLVMCEMLPNSRQEITDTMAEMGYLPVVNRINPKCRDTVFAYKGRP